MQETRAARLLQTVRAGTPLATASLAAGLAARTLPPVPRPLDGTAPPEGVPPSLVAPLFALRQGDATVVESADGFVVAQLQRIVLPDPASDPIGVGQLRVTLGQSVAGDVTQQFVGSLQRVANITVNSRLVQQIAQP